MDKPIAWAAKIDRVREVSLLGLADLDFWRRYLANRQLVPIEKDGHAQMLVIAAAMKFWGLPFREVSFSVLVRRDGEPSEDASYLIGAFNTRRFFAFCERAMFSTPYQHGDAVVTTGPAPSIQLDLGGKTVFHAAMRKDAPVVRIAEDGWEGAVHLPSGKLFHARIAGETRTYDAAPRADTFEIARNAPSQVIQTLVDSRFEPRTWSVRESATHAKSKTYARQGVMKKSPLPGR
jgi:hypothetical protein